MEADVVVDGRPGIFELGHDVIAFEDTFPDGYPLGRAWFCMVFMFYDGDHVLQHERSVDEQEPKSTQHRFDTCYVSPITIQLQMTSKAQAKQATERRLPSARTA